jgi:gamma-glutamylaminecyclotransferase
VSSKTLPTNQISMCVIIIKQTGKHVPQEVAKTSARINPHGLGIIWLDTFEVTYHKSSEYAVLDTKRPFIAHFRYATIGAINKENTHPFRCGSNKQEWLMMNGTIRALGNFKKSDSRVLAENLGEIPRHKWKKELEQYECRFVTINTHSRTYQVYNKELWVQKDGVWYSKDNVLEDNLVAVYGTLKKGYSNYNHYLTGSKHLGKGETKDKYPLVIQGLPYLIEKKGVGHNVEVDVFKVSGGILAQLDRLEGHPNWYRRKQIEIKMKDKTLTCWIYFNIRENEKGQELHKTYTQMPNRVKWYEEEDEKETEKVFSKYADRQLSLLDIFEDDCEDCGFDIVNEKPICVDCFHDLEHDGFANYHCSGCDGWFAEDEVLRFKP